MTTENKCKIKDHLVSRLIALNDKLNTLSPTVLLGLQARAEVQQQRGTLYIELMEHRAKGHDGRACPAARNPAFR